MEPDHLPASPAATAPKLRSLSFVVTFWTAIAIAVAMAVYGIIQFVLHPEWSIGQLVLHHLWHVLALGAVVHLTLWLAFRQILWRPLNQIYVHLYAIGKGQLEPLRVNSRIQEIATIADGINLMIWRIGREMDPEGTTKATLAFAELKQLIAQATGKHPDLFVQINQRLMELEQSLIALAQTQNPTAIETE